MPGNCQEMFGPSIQCPEMGLSLKGAIWECSPFNNDNTLLVTIAISPTYNRLVKPQELAYSPLLPSQNAATNGMTIYVNLGDHPLNT